MVTASNMNFGSQLTDDLIFRILADIAKKQHLPVFIIGGYVRDLLLKRPSKDIDIVCVGSGIALAKEVAARINKKKINFILQKFRHGFY